MPELDGTLTLDRPINIDKDAVERLYCSPQNYARPFHHLARAITGAHETSHQDVLYAPQRRLFAEFTKASARLQDSAIDRFWKSCAAAKEAGTMIAGWQGAAERQTGCATLYSERLVQYGNFAGL